MSHAQDDPDAPHEGPIKTPKQLIWAVLLAFVVPIIAIILLVNYVAAGKKEGSGSDGMSELAVAQRLQKIGAVEIKDVSDPASLKTGQQVFTAQCAACHATGAAGAAAAVTAAAGAFGSASEPPDWLAM